MSEHIPSRTTRAGMAVATSLALLHQADAAPNPDSRVAIEASVHIDPAAAHQLAAPVMEHSVSLNMASGMGASPTSIEFPKLGALVAHSQTLESVAETSGSKEKTTKLRNLHPEKLTIPKNVQKIMDRQTAYVPWDSCSGTFIYDKAGKPEGVSTALHCGLLSSSVVGPEYVDYRYGQRIMGSDGHSYIVMDKNLSIAMKGDQMPNLSKVNDISEFILPAVDDLSKDTGIAVFKGHSSTQVLKDYNKSKLPLSEIYKLKTGDKMYVSGWPLYQPKNHGPKRRQSLPLVVLGIDTWTVDSGQRLPLLITAAPPDKDGSECSWGNSGGGGSVVQEVKDAHGQTVEKLMLVGDMNAFNDLTGKIINPGTGKPSGPAAAAAFRSYNEQRFGVSLKGFGAICAFSFSAGNKLVKVAPDRASVPGYDGPESASDAYMYYVHKFADPASTKTILNGRVRLDYLGKGGGDLPNAPFFIDHPVIYHDALDNLTYIGYEDSSNGVDTINFFTFNDTSQINVYSDVGTDAINVTQATGPIQDIPADKVNWGSFQLPDGTTFGRINPNETVDSTSQAFSMRYDGNQLVFTPRDTSLMK